MEAEDAASLYGKPVVCGLGVETAASAVKALAAGAGAVVLHKLTPETTENAIRRMREQVCERLRYVGVQTISELHEKAEFIHICPHVL
jgi:dihydroorotate dehydrogenase